MKHSAIGWLSMLLILGGAGTCAGDTIGLYADNQGLNCNIVDQTSGVLHIYLVHISPMGADCDFNTVPAVGLTSTVNGDASCPCGYPVPVEETTWGRLKSLYTE